MKRIILENVRLMILATVFSLGLGIAFAWTDPASAPPTGNALTPLNRGSSAQVKSGGLWASSLGVDNGLIAMGNVGIGTITPTAKLEIAGTAGVDGIKFPDGTIQTTAAGGGSSPVGTVIAYGSATPPSGWLIADGREVSRTTYSDLFAVIGINFGTGDGINTFNVPDLRGQFIRGWNNSSGNDPDASSRTSINGGLSGDRIGSYQGDMFKSHTHIISNASLGHHWNQCCNAGTVMNAGGSYPTDATGGSETRPKNIYLMYIIKY